TACSAERLKQRLSGFDSEDTVSKYSRAIPFATWFSVLLATETSSSPSMLQLSSEFHPIASPHESQIGSILWQTRLSSVSVAARSCATARWEHSSTSEGYRSTAVLTR